MASQEANTEEPTEEQPEVKESSTLPVFPKWQKTEEKKDPEGDSEMDPTASGSAGPEKDSALLKHIDALKEEQKKQRAERLRLAKDLKNAEKRRKRLKTKAKMLSEGDLQEVLGMRARESAFEKMAADGSASEASPKAPSPAKGKETGNQ